MRVTIASPYTLPLDADENPDESPEHFKHFEQENVPFASEVEVRRELERPGDAKGQVECDCQIVDCWLV